MPKLEIFDIHGTLQRITPDRVADMEAQGDTIEHIPTKSVFTIKSGCEHKRARIVACGNYCSDAGAKKTREQKQTLYAGGVDGLSLRAQLRHCGLRARDPEPWEAGCRDIKTAFLPARPTQENQNSANLEASLKA